MKKKVKIIIWSVIGVVVAVAAAASVLQPLAVEATVMQSTTARVTFIEQGVYQPRDVVEVRPMLTGELLEIRASEGEWVNKGDVIAIISAKDVEYELERLESGIRGYNAQIANLIRQEQQERDTLAGTRDNLMGQLTSLDAQINSYEGGEEGLARQILLQEEVVAMDSGNVRLAREVLRGYQDEYGPTGTYRDMYYDDLVEYNALRQAMNVAERTLASSAAYLEQLRDSRLPEGYYQGQRASLEAQIRSIDERLKTSYTGAMRDYYNAMIESAQSSIRQLTEQKDGAVVVSPVNGILTELPLHVGAVISPGTHIATVSVNFFVEVFVPVREIDGVKSGDAVRVMQDRRLGDLTIDSFVAMTEKHAQVRMSALGVEERKVRVLISADNVDVPVGSNVDVEFTVFEQPDCVIAPKTAVFDVNGQDMVWVIENGAAKHRAIEKGVETRDGFAVISGLSHGDAVVTDANTGGLAENKRVRFSAI